MTGSFKKEENVEKNSFALVKLLPSIITIIGLCFGAFGFRCAINADWQQAITFIFLSSLLDTVDGCLARALDASSKFGAELDSLADFFNFSVAPAFTLYLWKLHEIKVFGWLVTLFFIICAIIRLARFNLDTEENVHFSPLGYHFFKGVTTPMACGLILTPVMLSFLSESFPFLDFELPDIFLIIYTSCISILMVSNFPTMSFKKTKIDKDYLSLFLAIVSLLIISLILEPWLVLSMICMIYLISIPITFIVYKRSENNL